MRIVTSEQPEIEPVTLAEAKLHARVSTNADDDLFNIYIKSIRKYVERYCNISIITQEKTIWFNYGDFNMNTYAIRLPVSPIQTIDSYTTYTDLDEASLVATSYYSLSNNRLLLNNTYYWPYNLRRIDGYKVVATVGFGDTPEDVPEDIKQAILMLVAHSYQNREALNDSVNGPSSNRVPFGVNDLLSPYKKYTI